MAQKSIDDKNKGESEWLEIGGGSFNTGDFKEKRGEWPERGNEDLQGNFPNSQLIGMRGALIIRAEGESALDER